MLYAIVKDAERFILRNVSIVQEAPLQIYASALVFSPLKSQVREENLAHYPAWFKHGPAVEDHWDLDVQTLDHDGVGGMAFSFDGKYLASIDRSAIKIGDSRTGVLLSTLDVDNAGKHPIRAIAFSRNGQLASVSGYYKDGEVRVWEPLTGVTRHQLSVNITIETTVAVAFAPNGTLAMSNGMSVIIWNNLAHTTRTALKTRYEVREMGFLSRGNLALACRSSVESEILIYDLESKAERRIPCPPFFTASLSSDHHVAIAKFDGKIRVYDLITDSFLDLRREDGHVEALAFTFNSTCLIVGYYDGSIHHCDLKSRIETLVGTCPGAIEAIASSPNSKLAVSSVGSVLVRIWDIAWLSSLPDGNPVVNSTLDQRGRPRVFERSSESKSICSFVLSRDGETLASRRHEGGVIIWSLATRRSRILSTNIKVKTMTFSSTGSQLVVGGADIIFEVWDPASGNLLRSVTGHSRSITTLASSPRNEVLVSGDEAGMMKFWHSKTWNLQRTLNLRGYIVSAVFPQDGRLIATMVGYFPGEIQIWDAEKYTHLQTFQLDDNVFAVHRLSIFADESYVITYKNLRVEFEQHLNSPSGELNTPAKRWRVDKNWLIRDEKRMLWLPPDFRPICTAIYNDLIALGHKSGKVTFFEGNSHNLTPKRALETTAPENESRARKKAKDIFSH